MAEIFGKMVAATKRIASEGIGKNRKNSQQGFNFRGIDDVMNAFAPILAEEGMFLRPRFTERNVTEKITKSGTAMAYITVKGEFDFVAADGSFVTVGPIYGEASDSGDKATNKAMAMAFKYAMFQAFCVPLEAVTGGDPDQVTPEQNKPARKALSPDNQKAWEAAKARYAKDGSLDAVRKHMDVSLEVEAELIAELQRERDGVA